MSHTNIRTSKVRYLTTFPRLPAPVKIDAAIRARITETRRLMRTLTRYAAGFDALLAALAEKERIGDREIQDLMGEYNRAESLASSIAKQRDCTADTVIHKA